MKKVFILIVLLILCVCNSWGQTYYYKGVKKVDKDGVQSEYSGSMYITFSRNVCYESDPKGNRKVKNQYPLVYVEIYTYVKTEGNIHYYCWKNSVSEVWLLVSSDFRRINHLQVRNPIWKNDDGLVCVYELHNPSDNIPDQLY